MNDTMTNVWDGAWEDAESGPPMRGHGVEIWVMRGGKFAVWEAAFNAGRADRASSVADLLNSTQLTRSHHLGHDLAALQTTLTVQTDRCNLHGAAP